MYACVFVVVYGCTRLTIIHLHVVYQVQLIFQAVTWGLDLVITDIDALVLRDPFPYFAQWPDAGFLTTTDFLSNTTRSGIDRYLNIYISIAHSLSLCCSASISIPFLYFARGS